MLVASLPLDARRQRTGLVDVHEPPTGCGHCVKLRRNHLMLRLALVVLALASSCAASRLELAEDERRLAMPSSIEPIPAPVAFSEQVVAAAEPEPKPEHTRLHRVGLRRVHGSRARR